ncbi:MAG: TIGR03915 family putative DNA repair protein [Lachnospiraceae bacterium]|nr:TIGR03915 family putative DNA repair protein [Lachnospiraceae bacterium]
MDKIVLLCDNSLDGMLTAIYDGFVIKKQRFGQGAEALADVYEDNIEIRPEENYEYEMFAAYVNVRTDRKKAEKTIDAIRKCMGEEAFYMVLRALCHYDVQRGSDCFGFLVRGFRIGNGICHMLTDPYVMRVMELARKAGNEAHLFLELLRFKDMGGILFGKIEPKCFVLPLIGQHFIERYPGENFIIYDEKHKFSMIHKRYGEAVFLADQEVTFPEFPEAVCTSNQTSEVNYERLWQTYFETIEIQERKNPRCQQNHAPLWYRKNMEEFSEKKG